MQMKKERTLLPWLLIAARKKPELYLEEFIGSDEFSIVSKDLFTSVAALMAYADKSKMLHSMEDMIQKTDPIIKED